MTFLLSAEKISKNFARTDGSVLSVIGDISLSLKAGEILCLLGASGSGKTTLLQILAGLDTASSGQVQSTVARPGPSIGYMTQGDSLLPWRTVLDNASLGCELLGLKKSAAREIAFQMLRQTGVDASSGVYPAQISGGMRQRVLLARTLATSPKLLLLDEPMSNLDILARRQMSEMLHAYVRTNNAAAVIVTHSVEEACALADRILLITRSPAVIYCGLADGEITLDRVMDELFHTLERSA